MSPSSKPPSDAAKSTKQARPTKKAREARPAPRPLKPLIETEGPSPDTPIESVMVSIGMVSGSHGVNGELKVMPSTDDVDSFFDRTSVWIGEETNPRRITSVRLHAGFVLLGLAGITSREECQARRGERIRIRAVDAAPLGENEFFLFQVIGLDARDETGEPVGKVVDLIDTGAKPVFVIRPEGGGPDLLLPNIPDAVLSIDPTAKTMVVRPLRYADTIPALAPDEN